LNLRWCLPKEANALGTAYLRADIIAEPQRSELKSALTEYTADRVALLSREGRDQFEPLLAKVGGLHERMCVGDQGHSRRRAVGGGNSAASQRGHRSAFGAPRIARRHLPIPIMTLLLGTAAIGFGMVGFGNGRVGSRFSALDSVYGVVLVVALW
jgi:hypothetical protein